MRPCASLILACVFSAAPLAAQDFGKDFVECKIELPNGSTYLHGATDPIADLSVKLTLTNKTSTERLQNETDTYRDVDFLTNEDMQKIEQLARENLETKEQREEFASKLDEFMKSKEKPRKVERQPVNKDSLGLAYAPPVLGPHDLVRFVITKVTEGDEKPAPVERNMMVQHTAVSDFVPTAYLAAGETSPEFILPAGKWYKVVEPGEYTIKAIVRGIGNSQTNTKEIESNEERFRVLPYKVVDRKVEDVRDFWDQFERGHPSFEYMFYELNRTAPYREIYYVQKVLHRGIEDWEWHRLCTVDPFTKVQVAQVTPRQVAILAKHWKGDAGLYTVDFSTVDPKVTSKIIKLQPNQELPKLRAEGGQVSAE
ncbi:MAG: hypothetical protein M5U26_26865 [Planctomycetota bacterium]|nr:hypothetical protein [Planctomycetota bacterium]